MQASIGAGAAAAGRRGGVRSQAEYVVEAEKLGVGAVWSPAARNTTGATP